MLIGRIKLGHNSPSHKILLRDATIPLVLNYNGDAIHQIPWNHTKPHNI